jgi:hypothetical protein
LDRPSAFRFGLARAERIGLGGPMLARRFLWIVASLIVLVMVGYFLLRVFELQLMKVAMVPTSRFQSAPAIDAAAYRSTEMWIARPDLADDPASWTPAGIVRAAKPPALVFFIHPTSFLQKSRWNAPLDDPESQWRARLFVQSEASAFNGVGEIWAPKYRQATFGAFLTTQADAASALAFAYRDVEAAWAAFLALAPRDRPIILAAHSQGSFHLMRLLAEHIAGRPEARRIVAAYVVGWPISTSADLPKLGFPACARRDQARCILAWQSFGRPADPRMITDVYDQSRGLTGAARAGSPMLCVNPITGMLGGAAPASANPGTLVPNPALTDGRLQAPGVAARCDGRGLLLIGGEPPELGPYVLPGNNYHVYDYALYWASIRADAAARLKAFMARK